MGTIEIFQSPHWKAIQKSGEGYRCVVCDASHSINVVLWKNHLGEPTAKLRFCLRCLPEIFLEAPLELRLRQPLVLPVQKKKNRSLRKAK